VATYRNPFPHAVDLSEVRDDAGKVWPTTRVQPGADVEWPIPIGGFELLPPPAPAAQPVTTEATTDTAAAAQPTAKASKKTPAAAAPDPAATPTTSTDAPPEKEATTK
jgi:hypothetical protein